ncbi:Retrotransposon protein [Nesidiocoris tenuis]|uniref:Retrotransposon protein n=1 Tax=Nesidiocoris tenuis TaxID=355587 RepID=A0ABN7BGR1_9HEMI|nr:Retrotransposon protein [Nesidiocoris tenuis]
MNNELLDFCFSQGIRVENTIPYCPFQNGKSEKLNRTLVEKARTLIAEYSLDQELWGEAIYCACYIINRLPTVDNHIPAERWMGEKPNYAKLKTFGCSAYALIPSEKRAGKFEEKSKKMTFVGYTTNGFRLWDADTRKIIRARHVIFDESPPEKKKYLPTQTEEKPEDIEPEDHDETGDSRSEIDDAEEEDRLEIENRNLKKKNQNLKKENRRLEEKEKESTPGRGTPSGTRQRKPPNWLKDFDISAHFAYSAADWISDIPKTRKEIHGREDEHLWEAAIQEELESMEKHKTWTRVEKPQNEEIIDSRWVFRIKKNEATGEERYKARLVAKGFQSSNYAETYSPVGKLSTFRTLISIVNEFNYEMEQMDVKTAFLHGDLKETIFMNLPEEMAEKNHVCKLNRSIYGLKQSPKNWYEKFDEFMLKENFKRSYHDSCLYSKITPKFKIYCFIYVDDLIIASDSLIQMKNFKSKLYQNFDMVNLGNVKSFLGLEVERDRDKGIIKLHQSAYINQLLRKFQMQDCKEISTPIEKNLRLNKAKSDEEKTEEPYRQLVGCLMYLMIGSRPDISFALNYFSRYQEYATNEHWTHLKRVLRYLKATNRLGLTFYRNNCENLIESYVDADWANDFEDRKSVTGFLVNVFGNIVSWGTRKQSTVSLSSTEAEYKALTTVICESLFINGILKDILCTEQPIVIFEDNVSCIHLAKNGENNKRTKHVEIKYHFIREKIKNNSVILKYIPTNDQRADTLTKALDVKKFNYFRNLMNIDVC